MRHRRQAIQTALAFAGALAVSAQLAAAAAALPNDPGQEQVAAGWAKDQWNFGPAPIGIDAQGAWSNLGAAAGAGVTIAVVDSGVAYRRKGARFARDPDLSVSTFVAGRDFVDHDRIPLDENGHGTHVASTIAQATNNSIGETGLAYGASIMPVRVLGKKRRGHASDIAGGIRWAVRHGADIVNLSLGFGPSISSCAQIPTVCKATRFAIHRGALVVAAAGNDGGSSPEMPAAAPHVLSVSASTAQGCLAASSNLGARMTAPGGGTCNGQSNSIMQFSMKPAAVAAGNYKQFGFVSMSGTSQAAAEVSAAAALVIASGVVGSHPRPRRVANRLLACATPATASFGAGILDAARATAPGPC